MNFVKKIADFFRGLFSKKSDSSSENNEQTYSNEQEVIGDSKFLVFVKKSLAFLYKYTKKLVIFILGLINTMMRPMVKISKKHPIAFWVAVVFHAALLFGLLYANVERWDAPQQTSSVSQPAPVQAVMIDMEIIEAEQDRLKDVELQKQQKLKNEEKRSETAKKDQKIAEQEALKAKAQKVFAEVKRKAEEAKAKEAEQLASEATKKIETAEAKRKAEEIKAKEAEAKRLVEEAKTKEAEILVQEAEKQKAEAEALRKAEEVKTKLAELKRKAEEAKTKEAELLAKEAEEKRIRGSHQGGRAKDRQPEMPYSTKRGLSGWKESKLLLPRGVQLCNNRFDKANHQREVKPHVSDNKSDEMAGVLPSRCRGNESNHAGFPPEVKAHAVQHTTRRNEGQEANSGYNRWGDEGQEEQGPLQLDVTPFVAAKRPSKREAYEDGQAG